MIHLNRPRCTGRAVYMHRTQQGFVLSFAPAATMLALLLFAPARAQQIWFEARGPDTRPAGASDWNLLFTPTKEWTWLASHLDVFSITAGYVIQASDEDLKTAFASLSRYNVKIALALQPISVSVADRCGHEEGYSPPGDSARAAAKLRRLRLPLDYVALDEPVWFGHFDESQQGCRLKADEVARRVYQNLVQYTKYFPALEIGDIEPIPVLAHYPDWTSQFEAFDRAISALSGRKLKFLHADVAWHVPSYRQALRTADDLARRLHMRFGVIYNGDGPDRTGEQWVADAMSHFDFVEGGGGLRPDDAIFQTWDPEPRYIFPRDSFGTLSYVVAAYNLPRTVFIVEKGAHNYRVRLIDGLGRAVPHATIVARSIGTDRHHLPPNRIVSGNVPANATRAVIGVRINTECLCAGENNLTMGEFVYQEDARPERVVRFSLPQIAKEKHATDPDWTNFHARALQGVPLVDVVVHAKQAFGFNFPDFSVKPGAKFSFRTRIGSVTGSGMFGYISIIWLGAHSRTKLTLTRDSAPASTSVTARDGSVDVDRDVKLSPTGKLCLSYAGSSHLRGTTFEWDGTD